MNGATRTETLARQLAERELDALLISAPANVRYLSGYTGSSGLALLSAEGDREAHRLFTDFRYLTQAQQQVGAWFELEIAEGDLFEALAEALRERTSGSSLGFDENHLTVKRHARLEELIGGAGGWELVACGGMVERLREVKDHDELALIRAAAELADRALVELLEGGLVGRTEHELAIELELRMRRLGAQGVSFPPIVAAGEHGALPHAEPRDVEIPSGVLVTIDWGAIHEGYCSDCTRTFATGEIPDRAAAIYELVRDAQEQAQAALRAGRTGPEVDAVARTIIAQAGFGEAFGHGLGHGVGMEVHESPRLSRTAGEEPLPVGTVVTVEPGVYLPGELGVRIEDLVVVTAEGCEPLSGLPKELTVM
jgi:Xaa-Pro aminopeptidase